MTALRIMAAQINPRNGVLDIANNTKRIAEIWQQADAQQVDLVVTPEQSLTGYPLEDLALQPDVLWASKTAIDHLVAFSKSRSSGLIVGFPEQGKDGIYNAAALIENGKILRIIRKHDLPNQDVFDEKRIYASSDDIAPVEFRGVTLGILICEDIWHPTVAASLKLQGAQILISPNASPWHVGKESYRIDHVLNARIDETGLPILYVNQVGGIDELIFDGHSIALNSDKSLAYVAKGFEESFDILTFDTATGFEQNTVHPFYDETKNIWQALVLGTRDYVLKNGFKKVHLGKSGGIDSAAVAAIAVDALGAQNVHLYRLPSEYTQDDSNNDAIETAKLLGTKVDEINIWPVYEETVKALAPHFESDRDDTTLANLQARIRGLLLMAISNRNNSLLLSTGNKSELTVGWATLYGDMNGAFNPLKGVDKLLVYKLCEWRNNNYPENVFGPQGRVIAQNTIDKRAKAELGPGNNFDEDVLPPYPVLVDINRRYVEENQSVNQIKRETAYDDAYVNDAVRRTDWSEFKRRQSCPGLKITTRDFGKGYRVPITRPTMIDMVSQIEKLTLDAE